MTGPMIAAPVKVAVQSATTCGKSACSASSGAIDRRAGEIIASTAPNTNAMMKSGQIVPGSIWLYTTRAIAQPTRPNRNSAGHPATVEAVGDPAAHEHEQHGRDELGEADESDVEFVAGDVERLLEQHRDQDVDADRGERRRPQVSPDGRVPQDISGTGHDGTLPTRAAAPHSSFASGFVRRGCAEIPTQTWIGGRSVGFDVVVDGGRDRVGASSVSPSPSTSSVAASSATARPKISRMTVTIIPPTP